MFCSSVPLLYQTKILVFHFNSAVDSLFLFFWGFLSLFLRAVGNGKYLRQEG